MEWTLGTLTWMPPTASLAWKIRISQAL